MTVHELKLSTQFYDSVANRFKTFEVRKDDRGFKVGDTLILKEVIPMDDGGVEFTGRQCSASVTYILTHDEFPAGVPDGYVIMSIIVLEGSKVRPGGKKDKKPKKPKKGKERTVTLLRNPAPWPKELQLKANPDKEPATCEYDEVKYR